MNLPLEKQGGLRRIIRAARYSCDGLIAALRHEAAFRQLLLLHSLLLLGVCCMDFEHSIKIMLMMMSFLSLIVELLNSAIEAVVDDISLQRRPLAKRAKDMGSAAQMLALIMTILGWIIAI